jgi:tetratricopeptide (TPR) repeat protein
VAKDYFDKSKAEVPSSEAGREASLKRSQINKLEEYRGKVAQADSLPNPEAIFTLAEIYLLDLQRPDSALVHYQRVVEKTPLSQYAPPSAYVAAWIVENSLQDTARGETMYRELITSYPATESANAARKRLGLPSVSDTTHREAARRLNQAEELLLKQEDVDGALALYNSVVADFPTSPYVPKAECAIAWTLEHVKGDLDSALVLYKALAQKYPGSECAALAQKKTAPLPPSVPAVVDTSRQVSADTTVAEQVPDEPTEVERGNPEDEDEDQRNNRRPRRQRPRAEQPQEDEDPENPLQEP